MQSKPSVASLITALEIRAVTCDNFEDSKFRKNSFEVNFEIRNYEGNFEPSNYFKDNFESLNFFTLKLSKVTALLGVVRERYP